MTYNDPIYYDKKGCYITTAQLRFFVNGPQGRSKFLSGDPEFTNYFYSCGAYNLVSDLMNKDPDCATLYWDEERKAPAFTFPAQGKVVKKFAEVGLLTSGIGRI